MNKNYFEFINSVKILSGEYSLDNFLFELRYRNCKKPLLLSDKGLEDIGLVRKFRQMLIGVHIEAEFTNIPTDSSTDTIDFIIDYYEDNACDGIIALGGGSVIDTAKCVKMAISQKTKEIIKLIGSDCLTKGNFVPLFVVPTTVGTGSECTSVAVVKNSKNGTKMEFISAELLPDVAFLDERLIDGLPPALLGSTAMDALCHAIESFTSLQKNPISDCYAIASIKLISENIIKAIKKPDPIYKRNLALGATLAGIAFSNSMVGVIHAIAHALGGVCGVPHSNAVAILMPVCMDYYVQINNDRYSELALYLTDEYVFSSTPDNIKARMSVEIVRKLLKTLNNITKMPITLTDFGVTDRDFADIISKAKNDGAILMNSRIVTKEDIYNILQMCL